MSPFLCLSRCGCLCSSVKYACYHTPRFALPKRGVPKSPHDSIRARPTHFPQWSLDTFLRILWTSENRSSRNVTQIQNHDTIWTNIKVKKTRFLSVSPPQPEGTYDGLCDDGWARRPRGEEGW